MFPRRLLPSTTILCAFEAAARLGSFTAAATELSLTQSAISRQIRALEELVGAELFVRERQTVRLTRGGEAYATEIRTALRLVSAATLGVRANPHPGTLNLAILPTFGTRWLAPRLTDFMEKHPGITINLTTRLTQFDFEMESVDAAIHFGSAEWPGAELEFLMNEAVVPACSQALRAQYSFKEPKDLLKAPLLHLASRPDAWQQWFAAKDTRMSHAQGMLVDQFAVAAQSAMSGLGVALLPRFLIENELARGDLIEAVDGMVDSIGCYYLAWPPGRTTYPPLRAFRKWLSETIAASSGDPVLDNIENQGKSALGSNWGGQSAATAV